MTLRSIIPAKPVGKAYAFAYSLVAGLLPLSFVIFITGDIFTDLEVMLAGVTCLFVANFVYGCMNLRDRLLFVFLHAGIALFLLSRPWVSVLTGNLDEPWYLSSTETTLFALTALYLSMMCLFLGSAFCTAICSHNSLFRQRVQALRPRRVGQAAGEAPCIDEPTHASDVRPKRIKTMGVAEDAAPKGFAQVVHTIRNLEHSEKMRILRIVSFACYLVCVLGALYAGSIKVSYMSGHDYTDYYLTESSDYVPWAVNLLEVMAPYMLCSFLATMPRRGSSVLALALYVCTTLPMLMIGSRSSFVIAFFFAALYFVFRHITDKEQVWISRRLIIACLVIAPFGIVAMGLMDYLRANTTTNLDFLGLVADALYKQGVSFTILGHGYDVNSQVQSLGFKFFSIGRLTDTITQGFIGQTFLGCTLLPTTNSVEMATQGWSYSHAMSYFAHSNYLGGEGYGSSYILELFADFGYAGIAGGSFAISCGLFALTHSLGRSWFWGACALISSLSVVHMPRGYADEWISFIYSTRFLLAVAMLAFFSAVVAYLVVIRAPKLKARLHESVGLDAALNKGAAALSQVSVGAAPATLIASAKDAKKQAAEATEDTCEAGKNRFGISVVQLQGIREIR